jgi:hypothetical protein
MTAAEQLTRALVDLATEGRRPRCGEPGGHELWCSDDAADRAQAARWCTGCPVLDECGAAADEHDERFGVFGGVDRTPPPTKRKGAPAAQAVGGVGAELSPAPTTPDHFDGSESNGDVQRDPIFQPDDHDRSL